MDGTNSTVENTVLGVLTGYLTPESVVPNLAASVIWAIGTWVGKPLLDKIPDFALLFARAGRLANHDLLRALRRAECQTVVTLCDLTLRDEFGAARDSLKDRALALFTHRSTPEFRALCHIRRAFSGTYEALGKMSVAQLLEVHGAAVSDIHALVAAGNECLAASNRNQLREQVVNQQLSLLDEQVRAILAQAGVTDPGLRGLALATGTSLPAGLRQRIAQHPQGWWELLPLAFHEELKDNPRTQVAWQMEVLSQLQHQWGDTYEAFEQKLSALDTTLTGMWDDLKSLRLEIDAALLRILDELEDIAATTDRTETVVNLLLDKVHPRQPLPFALPKSALAGKLFGREALVTDLVARLRRREHVDIWGPAGMGKSALAAEAIRQVVGIDRDQLARTPYPDGVVLLDLYKLQFTSPDSAWHDLADAFDQALSTNLPARDRARKACRGRQALVVIEGAEETGDGTNLQKLLAVLAPETTRLVLTRMKEQISTAHPLDVEAPLPHDEALALLRALCPNVTDPTLLETVHRRLGGHPLALTWAGSQLGNPDESPSAFVTALQAEQLPELHEPGYEAHTLLWLYNRTVTRLTPEARRVLAAAGMLAYQPLPLRMALVVLAGGDGGQPVPDKPTARNALKLLIRRGLFRLSNAEDEHWEFTHALAHQFSRTTGERDLLNVLGGWVLTSFTHAVTSVRQSGNFAPLGAALTQAATLLRADQDATALASLQFHLLYEGLDQIDTLGRLDFARTASAAVHDWLQRALARQPDDVTLQRELSVSHNRVGDVLVAQGQVAEALSAYTASRTIRAHLARQDPAKAQWQRNLAVSHNRVGDVLVAQGQVAEALSAYTASRTIRAHLARQDPANAQWQRDLAVSHNRVGNVLVAQGQVAEALSAYTASRTIADHLARQDPANAQWQRDLAVSHNKVGNVLVAQGQVAEALSAYTASRTIADHLARQDPTNAQWQRDLAVSHNRVGNVLVAQGQVAEALSAYTASRTIADHLARQDPANAQWQRDLTVSYTKLGNVEKQKGNATAAVDFFTQARAISARLVEQDPANAIWKNDLAWVERQIDTLKSQ